MAASISPVDRLNALSKLKSNIEHEIESQATILGINNSTLDSPLIDGGGFPRSDIDVWAVRHARVKIICLRNDLSSLVDKIAIALEDFYASQSAGADTDAVPLLSLHPFAKVNAVAPESPAQLAVSSHPRDSIPSILIPSQRDCILAISLLNLAHWLREMSAVPSNLSQTRWIAMKMFSFQHIISTCLTVML